MNRNTPTTLGALRIGDRFTYGARRTDVWQVMARADTNGKVAVNIVENGKTLQRHDDLKKKDTKVIFLRHTVIQPGEECFLEDLAEGDFFKINADDVFEHVLVKKGAQFFDVRRTDCAACIKGGRLATVIFTRKKEQA